MTAPQAGFAGAALPSKRPWGLIVAAVGLVAAAVVFLLLRPSPPAARSAQPAVLAASAAPGKSIAVLPFANLSTDKENEFFADGVQDDVITNLAKIRDLTVISRSSTLAYRDIASRNLKKIAAELGVASVLEGSVQRDGNRVRINVQLIDARTDGHLWAETYNKELTDRFSMQAALTQEIAAALKATLTPSEKTLIELRPTENQEAYEIYQRARAISQEVGEAGNLADYERILALYGQALAKDPSFALAHVQSALMHSVVYWFGRLDPSPARAEKTKAAAEAAIRLAPNAPESHLALGAYHYRVHRDWERALAEFRIAEAALPNDAQLYFWLAATHRRLGRWQEAVGYFERSATLGPRDLSTAWNYLRSLRSLRRWPQALAETKRSLEIFPADRNLNSERERVQFMLDGNRDAYFRRSAALTAPPSDPADLEDAYMLAMARGDWGAADRALTDPRITFTWGISDVISEPVALHRAAVAFLRGDHAEARRLAEQALVSLRGGRWNERQQPWVRMAIAEAEALAGQRADALREADAAMAEVRARDAVDFAHLRLTLARIHLVLDQRDAAFAALRESLASFCDTTPNEFRLDPFWARVKDDPRFEEILKAAKAL